MAREQGSLFHSLSGLVLIALKQLVVEAGKAVYLTGAEDEIHSFFFKAQKEFRDEFPGLEQAHFSTAGSFPWSEEISDMLWILHVSGAIVYVNGYIKVLRHSDTDEVTKEVLAEAFMPPYQSRKDFDKFVTLLKQLVRNPPGLA